MRTEAEIRKTCAENAAYVRVQIDGRWEDVTLAELPEEIREQYIQRWIEQSRDR